MTPPPSSHTHPPLSPPTLALPARRQASSSKRLLRRREAQGHPLVTVSWSPRPRKPHLAARVAHAHDQHPRPRPRPHPAHAHAHITAASHAPPTPRHHAPRHHATTPPPLGALPSGHRWPLERRSGPTGLCRGSTRGRRGRRRARRLHRRVAWPIILCGPTPALVAPFHVPPTPFCLPPSPPCSPSLYLALRLGCQRHRAARPVTTPNVTPPPICGRRREGCRRPRRWLQDGSVELQDDDARAQEGSRER